MHGLGQCKVHGIRVCMPAVVATRFWQRIGVDLLRGSSRAFQGRIGDKSGDDGSGVRYFQGAAGLAVAVGI